MCVPSQVDVDVQPTYVRVTTARAKDEGAEKKKNVLQLLLPSEVLADASTAKRSSTTGHLLLTCPKMCPVVVSKAPIEKKKKEREALKAAQMPTPMLQPPPAEPAEPGANLKPLSSGDSIRSIVAKPGEKPKPKAGAKADMVEQLGPDYDDEDDVPPLL
jgi:protein TilB